MTPPISCSAGGAGGRWCPRLQVLPWDSLGRRDSSLPFPTAVCRSVSCGLGSEAAGTRRLDRAVMETGLGLSQGFFRRDFDGAWFRVLNEPQWPPDRHRCKWAVTLLQAVELDWV